MLQFGEVSSTHPALEMLNGFGDRVELGLGDRPRITGQQYPLTEATLSATPPLTTMSALHQRRPHSVCGGC